MVNQFIKKHQQKDYVGIAIKPTDFVRLTLSAIANEVKMTSLIETELEGKDLPSYVYRERVYFVKDVNSAIQKAREELRGRIRRYVCTNGILHNEEVIDLSDIDEVLGK